MWLNFLRIIFGRIWWWMKMSPKKMLPENWPSSITDSNDSQIRFEPGMRKQSAISAAFTFLGGIATNTRTTFSRKRFRILGLSTQHILSHSLVQRFSCSFVITNHRRFPTEERNPSGSQSGRYYSLRSWTTCSRQIYDANLWANEKKKRNKVMKTNWKRNCICNCICNCIATS